MGKRRNIERSRQANEAAADLAFREYTTRRAALTPRQRAQADAAMRPHEHDAAKSKLGWLAAKAGAVAFVLAWVFLSLPAAVLVAGLWAGFVYWQLSSRERPSGVLDEATTPVGAAEAYEAGPGAPEPPEPYGRHARPSGTAPHSAS